MGCHPEPRHVAMACLFQDDTKLFRVRIKEV
ncbi:MAG: hypothetical protein QG628_944 [Patescibacteria group bacterium]|nr:hypothetical protein [Patescibacteria group bacterium]